MNPLVYWIWLSEGLGYGTVRLKLILEHFGSPEAFFQSSEKQWDHCSLTSREFFALKERNLENAEKILDTCVKQGISLLTPEDNRYPSCLWEISNPPGVLYAQGNLSVLESDLLRVAVVGARRPTGDGLKTAFEISCQMAEAGAAVVSGGALGVDQAALKGALQAEGKTVTVLGCGVDVDYPSSFQKFRNHIFKEGVIVSEYPPKTAPYKGNFPARNRLISGLSKGVLVVEASKHSGALITARLACEQNRDVFAVPGSIRSDLSKGTNSLIRDGAKLVTCAEDVIEEYRGLFSLKEPDVELNDSDGRLPQEAVPEKEMLLQENPFSDFPEEEFSRQAGLLFRQLTREPVHLDTLSRQAGLSAAESLQAVTELELGGFIQSYSGRRYSKMH